MKPIKVSDQKGQNYRVLRLRAGFSAIVFELSNGSKIEVDLMESVSGNLLLRAHAGTVVVSPQQGSLEVTTAISGVGRGPNPEGDASAVLSSAPRVAVACDSD